MSLPKTFEFTLNNRNRSKMRMEFKNKLKTLYLTKLSKLKINLRNIHLTGDGYGKTVLKPPSYLGAAGEVVISLMTDIKKQKLLNMPVIQPNKKEIS